MLPRNLPGTRAAATVVAAALATCVGACAQPAPPEEPAPVVEVAQVSEAAADTTTTAVPVSRLAVAIAAGEVSSIRLIGDSITEGVGCDGYGATTDNVIYQGGEGVFYEAAASVGSWANDFRAWASAAGVPTFVNAGIAGARMAWLADEPDAWLGEGADVIVVMLGTNDAVWSDEGEFADDARTALAAADAACSLLLVVSPPTNARTDGREQMGMETVDRILTEVCEERGLEHASLLDAVAADDGTLNDDLVHPTSEGSHAMWESLRAQLGLGE